MAETEQYKGWARCTCHEGPEKREQHRAELLPEGVTVEGLLFELNMLCCAWVEIGVDQWWGVSVDGALFPPGAAYEDRHKFRTYIQCDELDIGLMETHTVWAKRYTEITGKTWQPSWQGGDGFGDPDE
jgi:hypothetical protein